MREGPLSKDIRIQVEALRKKLLDLSLRNRMLNYRPSKRIGVSIVGEESRHLFSILVEENKKMTFVGKPERRSGAGEGSSWLFDDDVALEALREEAEEELDAYLKNPAWPVDVLDTKINTDEPESVLQAKLRTIAREAGLARDELGIHTLFLTLGILEWSENEGKTYQAPLLFVPVNLERQANGTIKLVYEGSDVGDNLPLRAKLAEFNLKLPEYDEDKLVDSYFAEVEATVRRMTGWRVIPDDVHLGFFNYEKYVMYMDLGGQLWPEGRKPWQHPELAALLGGGYEPVDSPIDERTHLDSVRPVRDAHEVFDADSSQTIAMMRVAEGLSIVVEGPPGTGKSQTITNIIAEAVASGKTVLFVAAKRAAVDVVKRNLGRAGLGAMCLDLHDKLTNRREFYAEIKRTVERPFSARDEEQRLTQLAVLREQLNRHSEAVNEPLPEFGASPFQAMSILAALPNEAASDREWRIPFEKIRFLKHEEVRALLPEIEALQNRLRTCGIPSRHPFWGAEIDYLDAALKLDLEEDLGVAQKKLVAADQAFTKAAAALKVQVSATASNAALLRKCLDQALNAPAHDGVAVRKKTWTENQAIVSEVVGLLRKSQAVRSRWEACLADDVWGADLGSIGEAYAAWADKWYRVLSGRFRQARRQLSAFLQTGAPQTAVEQLELVRDVRRAQAAETALERHGETMRRLVGVQWEGRSTDPKVVEGLQAWVESLDEKIGKGELPSGLLELLEGGGGYESIAPLVEQAGVEAEAAVGAYRKAAAQLEYRTEDAESVPFSELADRAADWLANLPKLAEFISLNQLRRRMVDLGVGCVLDVADHWEMACERLRETFARSYYLGVVREAMEKRPALKTFERESHEAALREFRQLDDFLLEYNRLRVRLAHRKQMPVFDRAAGNLNVLKMQCELTRKHRPIRWSMERAGEALQRIKPVFMMSPLSVAIHLPPEMSPFDLVIFDEASQIRPEDALSSIIRGRQVVVVGDTRQMPPTSFFDRLVDEDAAYDETPENEIGVEARKLESVLSLMSAVVGTGVRRPDLRWHYRSLHPTLIQPSNEMFYDNRLIVFPSPSQTVDGRRVGIVFHHLRDTAYEPGDRKRINRGEAEAIADRVLTHVREHPDQSLLVAAMNKAQADLIYAEVLKREVHNPEPFRRYQELHPHEPLDVKNLENVQGDERDVVFISVTYGRDANGIFRHHFGPLLREGGERRLNVLITRARVRCEVFSNITAEDIRDESAGAGVTALKRYLKFAKDGVFDLPTATGLPEESPFEEEVTAALRARGYEVHTQVGTEGYRIDIGVLDPDQPGRYLIGVECDGATYHSARSARDRDKLRQRVLESRGWKLHRIWSHDWWQDRPSEIERLVRAIEAARSRSKTDDETMEGGNTPNRQRLPSLPESPAEDLASEEVCQAAAGGISSAAATRPYVAAVPRPIGSEQALHEYAEQVVRTEGPITRALLMVRLREASRFKRTGSSLRGWFEAIIEHVEKRVRVAGDAFYTDETQLTTPRDWSTRPTTERRFDFVPEVELEAALDFVVRQSFGILQEDAVKRAYNLIGFRRVSEEGRKRGGSVVARMIGSGRLVRHPSGELRLPGR